MHSSRLLSAAIFLSMGVVTVLLGVTNSMLPTPGSEFFNIYEAVIQKAVEGFISSLAFPAVLLGGALIGAGLYLRRRFTRMRLQGRALD